MEHEQRVCPRCGETAGEYRFCEPCRAHIDSLTGISRRPGAPAGDATDPAAHVLREVLRLEQALAVVSKGITERIAAAPVHVEATAEALAGNATARAFERAKLATASDQRGGDVIQPPREVARLEDVLVVRPNDRHDHVAPVPSASALPSARPGTEPASPELERLPFAGDARPGDPNQGPHEVARLVDVLRVQPTPDHDHVAAALPETRPAEDEEAPAPVLAPGQAAEDEAAPQAFWFEPAETLEPEGAVADAQPWTPPESTSTPPEQPKARDSRRGWIVALCLLALVGLVVLLIGRDARRFFGGSGS